MMIVEFSVLTNSWKIVDDLAARFLVQRGGGLVGQDELGTVDQPAGDRHPLLLSARERPRLVVNAVAEPEAGEHLRAAGAVRLVVKREQLHRHLHVLQGRERLEQVVGLEDETQVSPQGNHFAGRGPVQFPPQHVQAAFLHRAQRADERQQRGLARARRAGHDDDLAAGHREVVVEEHLLLQLALAKIVLQLADPHGVAVVVAASGRRAGRGTDDSGRAVERHGLLRRFVPSARRALEGIDYSYC